MEQQVARLTSALPTSISGLGALLREPSESHVKGHAGRAKGEGGPLSLRRVCSNPRMSPVPAASPAATST